MPDVSRAQQRAMFAAKEGHSTLGIPQKVGAEFAAADIARGPKKLPAHVKNGKAQNYCGGGMVGYQRGGYVPQIRPAFMRRGRG